MEITMDSNTSSSFPPLRKVCVVGLCSHEGNREYNIYIIDLNSEKITAILALDEDSIFDPAFCLFGSRLYIFEGYHHRLNPNGGKSVLRFDLPKDISNLKLEKSMLTHDSYLNHVKYSPHASVTPSGRILVFSSCIKCCTTNYDFELYDPINRIWDKLPRLRPSSVDLDCYSFWITSFTFLDKSVLFLRTDIGVFTMDLNPSHTRQRWKTFGFCGAACLPYFSGHSLVVLGKDICLIPSYAYDIDASGIQKNEDVFSRWVFSFPDFKPLPDLLCIYAGVNVVDDDDCVLDDCNFCILQIGVDDETNSFEQIGVDDETNSFELMCDVYNCHLSTCREGMSKIRRQKIEENEDLWERKNEAFSLPGTTKIKSFKISLKADRFSCCSFSSIPNIEVEVLDRPTEQ